MDFWGAILTSLRRRWYAALAALAVSAGIALLTFTSIPTIYESTSVAGADVPCERCALLTECSPRGCREDQSASRVRRQPGDHRADHPAGATGPGHEEGARCRTGCAAGRGLRSDQRRCHHEAGPFPYIDVTSESPATSQDMTVAVVKRSVQELESRQKAVGAPPQTFITAEVLVKPTVPEAKINSASSGMRGSVVGPHSDLHLRCSVRARQRAHGTEGARVPGEPCGRPESGGLGGEGVGRPRVDTSRPPISTSDATRAAGGQPPSVHAAPHPAVQPVASNHPVPVAPVAAEPVGGGGARMAVNGRPADTRRRRPSPRLLDPPS